MAYTNAFLKVLSKVSNKEAVKYILTTLDELCKVSMCVCVYVCVICVCARMHTHTQLTTRARARARAHTHTDIRRTGR